MLVIFNSSPHLRYSIWVFYLPSRAPYSNKLIKWMEEIQRNIIIQMINCLIKLLLLVKYKKNFLVVFGLFSSDHPSGARPQVTYECDVMKSKLFFFLTLLGYPGPDSSNPSRSRREMASATMKVMSGNIGSNSPTVWA